MVDTERVMQWWARPGLTFPLSEAQLSSRLRDLKDHMFFLALSEAQTTGYGEFMEIDRQNLKAKLGRIIIHPKYRGKGLGTELMTLLADAGFQQLKLHRIYLNVYSFNEPAIQCYENVGFKKEALLRDYYRLGDKYWSVYRMSLLRSEWFAKD